MEVKSINYSQNGYSPVSNRAGRASDWPLKTSPARDSISFTSHAQCERILKKGYSQLIHQTAFDRDTKTKQFVCDYIRDTFGERDTIKIVSGGCSTGEEAVSYSMRLYDMRKRVNILGFDLGKKAIKQANSRKFLFEIPKNNYDFKREIGIESPYTDTYLISPRNDGLTPSQMHFKSLFNEFFEPTGEKVRTPFAELISNMVVKRYGGTPLELERKTYRLKDGMAENCKFIQGDVVDIDKILGGEKAEVISFCNALYHLTTTDVTGWRVPKKNAEQITEDLMVKFRKCLNNDGLVVFGEDEGGQLADCEMVPKVMNRLGFIPMNESPKHSPNVWKKG